MNANYRIARISNPLQTNNEVLVESIWAGADEPGEETISALKETLRLSVTEQGHEPLVQSHTDNIMLQRKRRPALLGWRTLNVMNIYRD